MTALIVDSDMRNTASVANVIRKGGGTPGLRRYVGDRFASETAGVNV